MKFGSLRSKKRKWVGPLVGCLIVPALFLLFFPPRLERQLSALCRVEACSVYSLATAEGDTLFFSSATDSTLTGLSTQRESAASDTVRRMGFFVSETGNVVTALAEKTVVPENGNFQKILTNEKQRLTRLHRILTDQLEELEEYAHTHSVTDEGYNDVMTLRENYIRRHTETESLLRITERALASDGDFRIHREETFTVRYVCPDDSGNTSLYCLPGRKVARRDGLMLLSTTGELPPFATYLSVYLLSPRHWCPSADRLFLGLPQTALDAPDAVALLPDAIEVKALDGCTYTADGSAVINRLGRLTGIVADGRIHDASAVARLLYEHRSYPLRLLSNIGKKAIRFFTFKEPEKPCATEDAEKQMPRNIDGYAGTRHLYGRKTYGTGTYCGRLTEGKPEGFGYMLYREGNRYEGHWKLGRREGYGLLTDTTGRTVCGIWQADTLRAGNISKGDSLYTGELNSRLRPNGYGCLSAGEGYLYQGEWNDGIREGFGISIEKRQIVKCGTWRNNRFHGERMVYTADRVYGIDISRYQHEIGKKRYGINWKRLRITHLGTFGNKRIHGTVNYPVSFVYVKSTQGTSIRNRYYAADIAQARRQGIATGAYHFFSTRTTGRQQADFFLKTARPQRGDLPPMLDLEPEDRQIAAMGGQEKMFAEVLTWLRTVRKHCGTLPVLYVSQLFVNKYLQQAPEELHEYPVWIARYGAFRPYVKLKYWQLAPNGRVAGIRGYVDINLFSGTHEQFEVYRRAAAVK